MHGKSSNLHDMQEEWRQQTEREVVKGIFKKRGGNDTDKLATAEEVKNGAIDGTIRLSASPLSQLLNVIFNLAVTLCPFPYPVSSTS